MMPVMKQTGLAEVRRKDRAVDDEAWIRALLERAPLGALASVHDGQPYINTNLFAYAPDEHAIYMHSTNAGRTAANVQGDERVCFSVAEMGRLLPAPVAFNMSVEYAGVAVFGRGSLVTDPEGQRRGLRLLLDKYFAHLRYGEDYGEITDADLKLTAVYRIEIEAWSGKQKRADDDHAGAFYYEEQHR
jgi:nitroimidazol reductase NimA-like FMN-containing flavoprotein (pyridoxamine 5'-phosphate oxidase superfamily)